MAVVRKWGDNHINKSIKQIHPSAWLVGDLVLHRSAFPSQTATWTDDGDNSSYTLTKAPTPLPSTTLPADSPYIKLVHEAGDVSAIWSIGNNAFCKVKYIEEGFTPESVTLEFVRDQRPSFEVPKVLHHAFGSDRSYLFLQRVPGRTLDAAWPTLNEHWRRHYVNAVVDACKEMAQWRGHVFGGVDGKSIPERYLLKPHALENFSSAHLQATCEAMGMDCFNLVFNHADLGPTNIIVENTPNSGKFGIIDFEIAGYFPRSWIRTKFQISGGMDLSRSVADDPHWWRREVQNALGANGFDDIREAWEEWWYQPSQT